MKASLDAIINEFAIRGLESQDHDLFMRRVANALNGYPKESVFFGRITKVSLKDPKFLPDLFGTAKRNIYSESRRNSAEMKSYTVALDENATAIRIQFEYDCTEGDRTVTSNVSLTVRQDSPLSDAFEYETD